MSATFQQQTNTNILWIKPWSDHYPNVIAGFTTRFGGKSKTPYHSNNFGFHVEDNTADVLTNRHLLAKQLNIPLDQWVMGDQVHHNHVETITKRHTGKGATSKENAMENTDGLFTKEKNILCTAMFADCVPLYFLDYKKEMIAISHAGWKGTVANIAQNTIQAFLANGSQVENIEVVIGPSICESCYQVSQQVIDQVDRNYQACYTKENGHYYLNLKQLNYQLLIDEGLLPINIHITHYCTSHDSLFFSHRRDQHPTGRMLGFITLI